MPDRVLLDTHALLWWQADSSRLSRSAKRAIESAPAVLVSPISGWEVALLVAKGRVGLDRPVGVWFADLLADTGPAVEAPLTSATTVMAGTLPDFHGDPADRMLLATAVVAGVALVTKDDRIRAYARTHGVRTIW